MHTLFKEKINDITHIRITKHLFFTLLFYNNISEHENIIRLCLVFL